MTSSGTAGALNDSSRAPLVLWVSLGALAALRLALAAVPSMWGWGFNLLRFVPPVAGWALWLVAALALVPPLARAATPAARRAGEALASGWRAPLVLALAVAIALLTQPDRVHMVGDFLLRAGTTERSMSPAHLYPQALPLDVLLHYELPRMMADRARIPVEATTRAIGAIDGAACALLAVFLARALELRGMAALAVTSVVLGGGFLGLFAGYDKAVAEMCLLSVAVAAFGIRAMRDPRALWPLGVSLALGFVLHRSGLGALPAAGWAWWHALRAKEARRPSSFAAIGLPLLVLGVMLPRIVATILRWDPGQLTPPDALQHGGVLRSAFSLLRAVDWLNVISLVSPLALLLPGLALAVDRSAFQRPGYGVVVLLAVPWVLLILFLHPAQGIFRDWDDYAPAGAAISVWVAWLVAAALSQRPRWEWLGLAVALGALAPTEQWLVTQAHLDRGLARVEAFLREPPARGPMERGTTWDWLGVRAAQLARWDLAAAALSRAAETAPSPRVLSEWGLAERSRGNEAAAQGIFRRVTVSNPDDPNAWYRLAVSAWRLGDYDECLRATRELERLRPGDELVQRMLEDVERMKPLHEPAK